MGADLPTRDDALALLDEFTESDTSVRHALAVEAVMRHMARKRGADEDTWGLVGLIHDIDYDRFPDEHCRKVREILSARGWPEEIIRAAESHGWPTYSDAEPQSEMAKTLYAVDELTGLVAATALVRPSRSVMDMKPRSVTKKWKDKSFAAGVDRETIQRGAEMLGVERSELIADTIEGMRTVAEDLDLAGEP